MYDPEEDRAVKKLQAQWRRLEANRHVIQMRQDKAERSAEEMRRIQAAIVLQRNARGYLARRPEALELARLHKLVNRLKRNWLIKTGRLFRVPPKPPRPLSPETSDDDDESEDAQGEPEPSTEAPATEPAAGPSPRAQRASLAQGLKKLGDGLEAERDASPGMQPKSMDAASVHEATAVSDKALETTLGDSVRSEGGALVFKAYTPVRSRATLEPREAWADAGGGDEHDPEEEEDDDVFFAHFGEY